MKKARVPMISTTGRQRSAWMAVPRHRANSAFLHAAAGIVMFAGGCALPRPDLFGLKDSARSPRIRLSCYASSTLGSVFTDADNLGTHHYDNGKGEKNGIIYTCKAGHIDLPHVRKAADWTAYLAEEAYDKLRKGQAKFSFKLWEPSRYYIHFTYPEDWKQLPEAQRDQIARDISITLGQYSAFTALTWHEIITWFGYRPVLWYPEFPSAFSWEDTFSNLLGTHLAGKALRDTQRSYDEAMTIALDAEVQRLGAQPKSTAVEAAQQVKGLWYSGGILFLVDIKKRNLDIGLDDGFVTPWIVPGLAECQGGEPAPYPVPDLRVLDRHGFAVTFEIEPREMERRAILKIVYPDPGNRRKRLVPTVHFAPLMEHIRQDAVRRYGEEVDVPG